MSNTENNELFNDESALEDFATCFLDIKDIELYKDSSLKMSRIEFVLAEHLILLKTGIINGEFTSEHVSNIKRMLSKDQLTHYFPNLGNLIEEFFAVIAAQEKQEINL